MATAHRSKARGLLLGVARPGHAIQALVHPSSLEHVLAVATRLPDQTCAQLHTVLFSSLKTLLIFVLSAHLCFLSLVSVLTNTKSEIGFCVHRLFSLKTTQGQSCP